MSVGKELLFLEKCFGACLHNMGSQTTQASQGVEGGSFKVRASAEVLLEQCHGHASFSHKALPKFATMFQPAQKHCYRKVLQTPGSNSSNSNIANHC